MLGNAKGIKAEMLLTVAAVGTLVSLAVTFANNLGRGEREMSRFAAIAGVALEDFKRMAILGERLGVEAEDMAEFFKEGSIRARDAADAIAENKTNAQSDAFKELGLDPNEFINLLRTDANQALLQYVKAVENVPIHLRARVVEDTVGGTGFERAVAPALALGSPGLEREIERAEGVNIISNEDSQRAQEFSASLTGILQHIKSIGDAFSVSNAKGLLPFATTIEKGVKAIADFIHQNEWLVDIIGVVLVVAISALIVILGTLTVVAVKAAVAMVVAFAPVSVPLLVITAVIVGLIAIFVKLNSRFKLVENTTHNIGKAFTIVFEGIKLVVAEAVNLVLEYLTFIPRKTVQIVRATANLLNKIPGINIDTSGLDEVERRLNTRIDTSESRRRIGEAASEMKNPFERREATTDASPNIRALTPDGGINAITGFTPNYQEAADVGTAVSNSNANAPTTTQVQADSHDTYNIYGIEDIDSTIDMINKKKQERYFATSSR